MRQTSRKEAMEITVKKFLQSEKGINDITELLIVAAANGKGMSWDVLEDIVRKALDEAKNVHDMEYLISEYDNNPNGARLRRLDRIQKGWKDLHDREQRQEEAGEVTNRLDRIKQAIRDDDEQALERIREEQEREV